MPSAVDGSDSTCVPPATGPAWNHEPTRRWLRRYAARSLALLLMAAAILIVAGLVIGDDGGTNGPATAAALVLIVADIFVIGATVGVWLAAGYARWRLAKSPWRSCPCRFVVLPSLQGSGEPTLVLDDGGQDHVLCPLTVKPRWRALDACDGKRIWFAGDPESGGVVAPPGGAPLLWVYRPRSERRRARLLQRAAKHDVRSSSITADDPERAHATDLAIRSLRLGALTQTALVGGVAVALAPPSWTAAICAAGVVWLVACAVAFRAWQRRALATFCDDGRLILPGERRRIDARLQAVCALLLVAAFAVAHLHLGPDASCRQAGVSNGKEGRCTRDGGFVYAVNSGHTLHTPLFSAALTDSWAMPVSPDQVLTPSASVGQPPNEILAGFELRVTNTTTAPQPVSAYVLMPNQDGADGWRLNPLQIHLAGYPALADHLPLRPGATVIGWIFVLAPTTNFAQLRADHSDLLVEVQGRGYGEIRLWKTANRAGTAAVRLHAPIPAPMLPGSP